ncbi:MAG: hypothetical protein J5565_00760 [Muribaculaceae bacterium]|nr:hypothetical protein [Muribaculaceae bacterium]
MKKSLLLLVTLLASLTAWSQQTVVNVVERTVKVTQQSTLYVGEVVLDGQPSFYYLYSEDLKNSETVFAAVRDCLSDFKDGNFSVLMPNIIGETENLGIAVCSNNSYEALMTSDWTSAVNAGQACLSSTTVNSSSSVDLYETDADFAAKCIGEDFAECTFIDDEGNDVTVSGVLGKLATDITDDVTYTVIDGSLVKLINRHILYSCEMTTVMYTKVELEATGTGVSAIGRFTVSSDRIVEFAPGNVQYHTGTQQWRFANNQYDVVGVADNISLGAPGHSAWIDLFAWSCESSYYGVNPSNKDADYTGDFVDWGNQFEGEWFTLAKDELQYLLTGRSNASNLRAEGSVNGIHGLILLPDNWELPEGIGFNPGYIGNEEYTENDYTIEQWGLMEAAGAVFLPHAGSRTGGYGNMWNGNVEATFVNEETGFYSWVDNVQVYGYYWTSTINTSDENFVYYLITPGLDAALENYTAPVIWSRERRRGNSVRLVRDVVFYNINISDDFEHGTVTCNKERAAEGETVTLTVTPDNGYELQSLTVSFAGDDEPSGAPMLAPHRANVDYTPGSEPNTYTFDMPAAPVTVNATFKEATVTGVQDINAAQPRSGQRYNVMGQPVGKDYKGIVIEDGTKRVIK